MGSNKCRSCGQWAGKGHKCPAPASPAARIAPPARRKPKPDPARRVLSAEDVAAARTSSNLQGVKTRQFPSVVHIGTLDVADRGDWSLEGEGLSVSVHPDAWQRIAKLGGRPRWAMERTDGKPITFLDAHRLTAKQRETIKRWGLDNGIVTETEIYTLTYYDDEWECDMTLTFESREAAEAEAEASEYDPDEIETHKTVTFTEEYSQRGGSGGNAESILLTVWAEHETDYDGVWWNDDLDPSRLSAPRGVILPSRLSRLRSASI